MELRKKNFLVAALVAGIALLLYLYSIVRIIFSSSDP
jgi:hypothetical protein